MATNGQAAAGGEQSGAPCHLHHLHVGFLPLSVSREQKWVTVAVVGCPAWPAGSGTVAASAPTFYKSSLGNYSEPPGKQPFVLFDSNRSHEYPPSASCTSQLPYSPGHCPSRPWAL